MLAALTRIVDCEVVALMDTLTADEADGELADADAEAEQGRTAGGCPCRGDTTTGWLIPNSHEPDAAPDAAPDRPERNALLGVEQPRASRQFGSNNLDSSPCTARCGASPGDPDELERGYTALISSVPETNHVLHAAARTPDGLLVFDTCPSREAFEAFYGRPEVRALFAANGLSLDEAVCEDHPVIRAYASGARVDESATG